MADRSVVETGARELIPCPKCGQANFDHYPGEDTRYCLECGEDSFIIEGNAVPCTRPETGDGGWFVPAGIAKELFTDG